MNPEKPGNPEASFESLVKEIESVQFPDVPERGEWTQFLEELKATSNRLKYLEDAHTLHTTDRVPHWPEGVRRYLIDALNSFVVPKRLTADEESSFRVVLVNYKEGLCQWKEQLLDRAHNRAGKEREIPDPGF